MYLRALVCSTYNSVIMHYDIDHIYIYMSVFGTMMPCHIAR